MNKAEKDTKQLVTSCIRKGNLQASTKVKFPKEISGATNTDKDHFVQLDVIIHCHAAHYSTLQFRHGVRKLMILRDHYNMPGEKELK